MPNEEKEKLSEGEALYNLTQSDEWQIFKDRFEDVVLSLADIRNIPFTIEDEKGGKIAISSEQRTYEMQVRERTLMLMQDIFGRITGDVEEYTEMIQEMKKGKREPGDFIIMLDK